MHCCVPKRLVWVKRSFPSTNDSPNAKQSYALPTPINRSWFDRWGVRCSFFFFRPHRPKITRLLVASNSFKKRAIMGDSFEIRISSNLVNQIADSEQNLKKTKKPRTKIPQRRQNVEKKVPQKQASSGIDTHNKSIPNTGWPPQAPVFLPISPPPSQIVNTELDAIRAVIRDSEATLERLQKKEENKLNEVTQRAKEMRDKEFKLPHQNPMPCLAEKEACFECYSNHVKDPLKCGNVVKTYADCVRKARQQVSSLG